MAHTFDVSAYSALSTAAPHTLSFTASSGATLLVLGVFTGGTAARAGGTPTFGGITMQRVYEFAASASYEHIPEMWYHLNPSTGSAYTISVPNTGTARSIALHASSYSAQSGWLSAFDVSINAEATTGVNPSITITPSSAGNVVVALLGDGRAVIPSAQTLTYLSSAWRSSWSDSTQYTITADTADVTAGWTVASDDNRRIAASFYEYNPSGQKIYTRTIEGTWKQAVPKVYLESAVWKTAVVKVYTGGTWKTI